MFWGLVLEPGKRYSTTVEKSFHVSKAALDCSSVRNDQEILSVMLETEGSEALLCNLCKQKGILQEDLDLNFMSGDRLTFECRGHGRIHLSGYLLPDEEDDLSGMLGDEEESEEEEEETPEWSEASSPEKQKKEKRKQDAPQGGPAKKKKIAVEDEGDSDSDQDAEGDLSEEDEDVEDEEDDDDEMNDKEEDDSEDDDEEETIASPKEKQKPQQKQEKNKTPNKQNINTPKKTPVTNGVTPKEQKSNKKTPGGEKSPNANATPKQKQVLEHGVVVKEIRAGNGVPAKLGKSVTVYYVGKLKDGGKVFDKSLKGEGFKFKLGKGEVIKGWDIGVQGMKVGGKRVIHCPPEAAYGAKGIPPKIPPNSTLIFEVELKNVH